MGVSNLCGEAAVELRWCQLVEAGDPVGGGWG